jgi:putative transposase
VAAGHRSRRAAAHVGAAGVGENSADAITVVDQALAAAGQTPCLFLSDNGVAFNQTPVGRTSQLVSHLKTFGCRPITGRISHPQTQGKDERAHQTLQRWLEAHPTATQAELQEVVNAFDDVYNHHRPHQSLGMQTPAQALQAGPVAIPPEPPEPDQAHAQPTAPRVQVGARRVAKNGNLVVRRHIIQMGLEASGTTVTVITSGATVNVFNAHGAHIRSVVLVPGQRYYGNGKKSPGAQHPPHRPHLPET